MKKYFLVAGITIIGLCAFQYEKTVTPANIVVNGKLYTALFQQRSAEYKALCIQAYTVAHFQLDIALQKTTSKPKAVISDIDETILDNSPFAVHQALLGKGYEPAAWQEWTSRAEADTLAGALAFFKYASDKKVEIYYISNRSEKEREGTLQNLKKFGFPNADNTHLILKESSSSKESRRQTVMASHDVLLLLGDNLADFSEVFDNNKTSEDRTAAVQKASAAFGTKFIVLPNPNYGDWENVIYNYKMTNEQKDSVIRKCLKNY